MDNDGNPETFTDPLTGNVQNINIRTTPPNLVSDQESQELLTEWQEKENGVWRWWPYWSETLVMYRVVRDELRGTPPDLCKGYIHRDPADIEIWGQQENASVTICPAAFTKLTAKGTTVETLVDAQLSPLNGPDRFLEEIQPRGLILLHELFHVTDLEDYAPDKGICRYTSIFSVDMRAPLTGPIQMVLRAASNGATRVRIPLQSQTA